jgi:hypothetical protein
MRSATTEAVVLSSFCCLQGICWPGIWTSNWTSLSSDIGSSAWQRFHDKEQVN